jgi:hypothetical protein
MKLKISHNRKIIFSGQLPALNNLMFNPVLVSNGLKRIKKISMISKQNWSLLNLDFNFFPDF